MTRSRDASDLVRLEAFLSAPQRMRGTFSLRQVHGFLFAAACSPEDIPFEDVLPVILCPEEGPSRWRRIERAGVLQPLLSLYNENRRRAARSVPGLPAICALRSEPMANLEKGSPIAKWLEGFGFGHVWLRNHWDEHLSAEEDLEIGAALKTLIFFGSREAAETIRSGRPAKFRPPLEEMAEELMHDFEDALATYARIGRSLRSWGRSDLALGVGMN